MLMDNKLLSLEDAAKELGVSKQRLHAWVKKGLFSYYKMGDNFRARPMLKMDEINGCLEKLKKQNS